MKEKIVYFSRNLVWKFERKTFELIFNFIHHVLLISIKSIVKLFIFFSSSLERIIRLANKMFKWIFTNLHLSNIWSKIQTVDANKQKLIGYRGFGQFSTKFKGPAYPFDIEWCMKYSECNAMQKCSNCAVWFVWITYNIGIFIEHYWIYLQ